MYEIFKSGYSRIPVYDNNPSDVVGIIYTRDLVFVDPDDNVLISKFLQVFGRKPLIVWYDQLLGDVLSMLTAEGTQMAIVRDVQCDGECDPYYVMKGVVTLKDIIAVIIGIQIKEETVAHLPSTTAAMMNDLNLDRFEILRSKVFETHSSQQSLLSLLPTPDASQHRSTTTLSTSSSKDRRPSYVMENDHTLQYANDRMPLLQRSTPSYHAIGLDYHVGTV